MFKINPAFAAAAAVITALVALPAHADPSGDLRGVWRNPHNSVHVEIKPCGPSVCGYVVWANEKARRDAREGGTPELIGQQLFREFSQEKSGVWKGRVFVPDIGKTFSGSAERLTDKTLKAKGCLFANILCKSQTWSRVDS